jgi:NADH-quinone oxidoreductase subunit C
MTAYTIDPCALQTSIREVLAERTRSVLLAHGEVTVEVAAADYLDVAVVLRDAPQCQFNQLIDLCAVDYSQYKDMPWEGLRFCVVLHLLSTTLNQRLRLKVFAADDEQPRLASVNGVWNAANWFEREAFDLLAWCLTDILTCGASLPIMGSSAIPCARIFLFAGMWKCITTPSKSAWCTGR